MELSVCFLFFFQSTADNLAPGLIHLASFQLVVPVIDFFTHLKSCVLVIKYN